jgi:RHS repeat-associated protein
VVAELWDTVGGLPNLAIERNAANVVQRRYTYGRGTETLRFQDVAAGTAGWYQTDALGSVANITNATGVASATYTYTPFGTARLNTTLTGYGNNPLKYTGQHQDPTGMYNLRARYYNPGLGRFTQTDPMPLGAGSAFESVYVYGGDMPTVMVDPGGKRFGLGGHSDSLNPVAQAGPFISSEDDFVLMESGVIRAQSGGFSGIGCKRDVHRPTRQGFRIEAKAELRCHTDVPGRTVTAVAETCLDGRTTSKRGWFGIVCRTVSSNGFVPLTTAYSVILAFDLAAPCENKGRYRTEMMGGRIGSPQGGNTQFGKESSGAIGPYRDCGSILDDPYDPDDGGESGGGGGGVW